MLASSIRRAASTMIGRRAPLLVAGCQGQGMAAAESWSLPTIISTHQQRSIRPFATTMPDDQLNKRLDTFQHLFVEARLCIEDVVDAAETTYFDDDAETAKEAVAAAVNEFNAILNAIEDTDQKNRVLRSNGLKVEQLKGELEMAVKGGHH